MTLCSLCNKAKAESDKRRLLEAKLAVDAAEEAKLKVLAEARIAEEEAARAAEEKRIQMDLEKARKAESIGKTHACHVLVIDILDIF